MKTKFSYSWLTNRIGNIWDIIEHPCQDAATKQNGVDLYSVDAFANYAFAADVSQVFHTQGCLIPHVGAIPSYPCADSYPGFSDKIDLDLCKCIFPFDRLKNLKIDFSHDCIRIFRQTKIEANDSDDYRSVDRDRNTCCPWCFNRL